MAVAGTRSPIKVRKRRSGLVAPIALSQIGAADGAVAPPNRPARQPSAGEIILHRRVRFLALAAALTLPADHVVTGQRAHGA